tara:strand:+ start:81 stop:236 length:156 start_codon:yes stop_codon:yes gene_type:complete
MLRIDNSVLIESDVSIVPNKIPRIGIIRDMENREKTTDKKLKIVLRIIRLK